MSPGAWRWLESADPDVYRCSSCRGDTGNTVHSSGASAVESGHTGPGSLNAKLDVPESGAASSALGSQPTAARTGCRILRAASQQHVPLIAPRGLRCAEAGMTAGLSAGILPVHTTKTACRAFALHRFGPVSGDSQRRAVQVRTTSGAGEHFYLRGGATTQSARRANQRLVESVFGPQTTA